MMCAAQKNVCRRQRLIRTCVQMIVPYLNTSRSPEEQGDQVLEPGPAGGGVLIIKELPMEKNPKVLIVEDNEPIVRLMREMLSLLGFDVVGVASTVSDALNQAEIVRPQIAIFDVRLGAG